MTGRVWEIPHGIMVGTEAVSRACEMRRDCVALDGHGVGYLKNNFPITKNYAVANLGPTTKSLMHLASLAL